MMNTRSFILLASFAGLAGVAGFASSPDFPDITNAQFVRNYDGDTITVTIPD